MTPEKKKISRLKKFLFCTFLSIVFFPIQLNAYPEAENGILDLRDITFDDRKIIELHGEFLFYRDKFVPYDELFTEKSEYDIFKAPRLWNQKAGDRKTYPAHGIGTFAVKILLPDERPILSVRLDTVYTAYILYANGKPVKKVGTPGRDKSSSIPHLYPGLTVIEDPGTELILSMHVSNFHAEWSGFWEPLQIGSAAAVRKAWESQMMMVLFISGALIIMALYHLAIFSLRREEKGPLYVAIFCFLMFSRAITMDQRLITHIFEGINWSLVRSIEFGGLFWGIPVFALLLRSIFPGCVSDRVIKVLLSLAGFYTIIELFRIPFIHPLILPTIQLILVLSSIYFIYSMILAFKKKLEGASVFAAGLAVFLVSITNDMLHTNEIINTGHFAPFGLLGFIFSQAFILSRKFSIAFRTSESLSIEIEHEKNSLVKLVEKIRLSVSELKEFASTIKLTADNLQSRMTNQGSILQETSSAAEEVSASIDLIDNKTSDQNGIVQKTVPVIQEYLEGLKKITAASENAEEISIRNASRTEESAEKLNEIIKGMDAIRQSSSDIGEITFVINDIAEKTNLLSLNASIEAARAGEAGKGFAVVAEEIGKLADLSIEQAKSIQKHIQSAVENIETEIKIVNSSEETIRSIGRDAGDVLEGIRSIRTLCVDQEKKADELRHSTEEIADRSAEITRSTGEQKTTVSEVAKSIEELNEIMYDVMKNVDILMDSLVILNSQTATLSNMIESNEENS